MTTLSQFMPTTTFLKLSEEKRERFVQVALKEFAQFNYETASINRIIQELGIARGSVYQYFEDKLDLWLYLKSYAEEIKMNYIKNVNREKHKSFWDYYKALYISGIDFDLEQPHCSQFLYRIGFKESSIDVLPYIDGWKKKANTMFTELVKFEQKKGSINKKIPTATCVHFLITMSMSIADLLQTKYKVDFDKNLKSGKPLYGKNKKELIAAVDELISLLVKALK